VGYAFDRLGFLQFEQLCASLLRIRSGIDAETWSGEADVCRTVLSGERLGPPLTPNALPPPVLIHCVWVRDLGWREVLDAVDTLAAHRPADISVAASYLLVTNADTPSWARQAIGDTFRRHAAAICDRKPRIAVLGAAQLSALVDATPELRRTMPSLLGLRELAQLIAPDVAERSSIDLGAASTLAPVFVPTRAHRRALEVLDRHRFAVLTGPPEMGKTAIARTIGLAQMTVGWEAHECVSPAQLAQRWDATRPQLFIADDAFGSTEYRPDSAERWAVSMERTLRSLDESHWLIWTSRPAPLRAGLARLHRERGAERFPAPAEVLVDAAALDPTEKTLILFRHAKAADLSSPRRAAIRSSGAELVAHPHFTPERIRRLIAALQALPRDDAGVAELAHDSLGEVTASMATSFAALGAEHRDLLVAMLDTPPGPVTERDLTAALRRHHEGALTHPPAELVDRLTDHFLRVLT
jgi:hypothetical protein